MQKQLAIKIMIIFAIGIAILISINMVASQVDDRKAYLHEAETSVARSWTGKQLLITPVIVIPYQLSTAQRSLQQRTGFNIQNQATTVEKVDVILPQRINGNIQVDNKSIFKGIYEIPVYSSDMRLSGTFLKAEITDRLNKIKNMQGLNTISKAYISIYISDVRGINKTPELIINNKSIELKPGAQLHSLSSGLSGDMIALDDTDNDIPFSFNLSLKGMDSVSFIPLADNADINITSNWPHPEFIGASLPDKRAISSSGFKAHWASTRYSNNAAQSINECIKQTHCQQLFNTSSGVRFIDPVDIYVQSERSIKYAILFIGLSFITFFIFEHLKKIRIHPIQYTFVGLATAVFYLLLISLAEHITFYWAYLIAATACISILLAYLKHTLKSLSSALLFTAMIALLYNLLYAIIQAEDFALLMGSI